MARWSWLVAVMILAGCSGASATSHPSPTISLGAPSASLPASDPHCRSLPSFATIRRISGYRDLVPVFYYDAGQRSCAIQSANGLHSLTFGFFAGDGRTVVLRYHSGHRSRTVRNAVVTNDGLLLIYRRGFTYSVSLNDDADPRTAAQLALLRAWGKL